MLLFPPPLLFAMKWWSQMPWDQMVLMEPHKYSRTASRELLWGFKAWHSSVPLSELCIKGTPVILTWDTGQTCSFPFPFSTGSFQQPRHTLPSSPEIKHSKCEKNLPGFHLAHQPPPHFSASSCSRLFQGWSILPPNSLPSCILQLCSPPPTQNLKSSVFHPGNRIPPACPALTHPCCLVSCKDSALMVSFLVLFFPIMWNIPSQSITFLLSLVLSSEGQRVLFSSLSTQKSRPGQGAC